MAGFIKELPKLGRVLQRRLHTRTFRRVSPHRVLRPDQRGARRRHRPSADDAALEIWLRLGRHRPDAAAKRIQLIGQALHKEAEAATLIEPMKTELQATAEKIPRMPTRPKVLFIYTRGGGIMNVAGRGTGAEAVIELAGGVNGYKPLTAEGADTAAPDFLLVSSRGLETSGGIDELLK